MAIDVMKEFVNTEASAGKGPSFGRNDSLSFLPEK